MTLAGHFSNLPDGHSLIAGIQWVKSTQTTDNLEPLTIVVAKGVEETECKQSLIVIYSAVQSSQDCGQVGSTKSEKCRTEFDQHRRRSTNALPSSGIETTKIPVSCHHFHTYFNYANFRRGLPGMHLTQLPTTLKQLH